MNTNQRRRRATAGAAIAAAVALPLAACHTGTGSPSPSPAPTPIVLEIPAPAAVETLPSHVSPRRVPPATVGTPAVEVGRFAACVTRLLAFEVRPAAARALCDGRTHMRVR